ncbi:MAG: O-antigen ligase family protein [Candidatus Accumulibacter sp.]|nr:O-antigen ligase family protein [Accumulibacter sp.]
MSIESHLYLLNKRASSILVRYVLPMGWLLLLTGMFWLWKRSLYSQTFYLLLALPCLLVLVSRSRFFSLLIRQPLFIAIALFSGYMLITLIWSETSAGIGSLIKRPFYIALLLFSAGLIVLQDERKLEQILSVAGLIAVLSAACSLAYFLFEFWFGSRQQRLPGYGVLLNPLLTSHIYGAFASYWLARWFLTERNQNSIAIVCLVILGVLLVATGSRTPFLGLGMALTWLAITNNFRRALLGSSAAILLVLTQYWMSSMMQTWAGVSYRPAIWMEAIRQIGNHPWIGNGYGAPMTITVHGLGFSLADPHNIELGVAYAGGMIGLALWAGIYACALGFAWRYRREKNVLIASTWLVFGLGAGLTEGSAFMPRLKEHWFLIWIPMALLYAQWLLKDKAVINMRSPASF